MNAAFPLAPCSTSPADAPPTDPRITKDPTMNSEDLGFLPAVQAAEMIRTKKLSPVEYVGAILQRVQDTAPRVNAFAYLAADQAMDAAKRAEAALLQGGRIGRLHGVPVTIKDLTITADMPTQSGS